MITQFQTKYALITKSLCILIIQSFVLSGIIFAEPAGTASGAADTAEIALNPEKVIIPRDCGMVKSKFTGKSGRLIIHIQDAHCNFEAQSNIARIIETLVKNNNLNFVSVEGADGLIDTSWFKSFPDAEVRKEVATYFMKKGEITGPEFLSITTDYPIKLFGAETREYYIENLNAFTASYPLKEQTEKYFGRIKSVLNNLKGYIYNDDLKAMDAKAADYEAKKLQFNDYIRFLQAEAEKYRINIRQYDNLFKLINVLVYEKKINFDVTDKERGSLIDDVSKRIGKDAMTGLVNQSIAFKVGKLSSADYYAYLRDLAVRNGIDLMKDYPNLYNYIIYNSVYSKIENDRLFAEIKKLESAVKEKLFQNDDQRTLEKLSRHIDTLIGLINIKLLNDDFEYYKGHKEEFTHEAFASFIKDKIVQYGLSYELDEPTDAVTEAVSKLEDFYYIAIKRDKALVQNTLNGMEKAGQKIAVLVTGGFHSEGMAKLLEQQDISYLVICPSITKDVPTNYIQILTNQRTPFEEILVGPAPEAKRGMLAPAEITYAQSQAARDLALFLKHYGPLLHQRVVRVEEAWIRNHATLWLAKRLRQARRDGITLEKESMKAAYMAAWEAMAMAADFAQATKRDAARQIVASAAFTKAFDDVYARFAQGPVIRIAKGGTAAPAARPEPTLADDGFNDTPEAQAADDAVREKTSGANLTNSVIKKTMSLDSTKYLTLLDDGKVPADAKDTAYAPIIEDLRAIIGEIDEADLQNALAVVAATGRDTTALAKAFTKEALLEELEPGKGLKIKLVKPADEIRNLPVPAIAMLRVGANYGHYSVTNKSIYCAWGLADILLREPRNLARRMLVMTILHELIEYVVLQKMFPDKNVADNIHSAERVVHDVAEGLEKELVGRGSTERTSALDDKLAAITEQYYQDVATRLLNDAEATFALTRSEKRYLGVMWQKFIDENFHLKGKVKLKIIKNLKKLIEDPDNFDPNTEGNFVLASMLTPDQRRDILGATRYEDIEKKGENALAAQDVAVTAVSLDGGRGENVGRKRYIEEEVVKELGMGLARDIGAKGTDLGFVMPSSLGPRGKILLTIAEAKMLQMYTIASARSGKGKKKFGSITFRPLVSKESSGPYKTMLREQSLITRLNRELPPKTYEELLSGPSAGVKVSLLDVADLPWIVKDTGDLQFDKSKAQPGGHGQVLYSLLYDAFMMAGPAEKDMPQVQVFYNGDNLNSRINEHIVGAMINNNWPIVKLTTMAAPIDKKGGKDGVRIKKINGKIVSIPAQLEEGEARRVNQLPDFHYSGLAGGLGEEGQQPFNTNIIYINTTLLHKILKGLADKGIPEERIYDIIAPDLVPKEKKVKGDDATYVPIDGAAGVAIHNLHEFFLTSDDRRVQEVLEENHVSRVLNFVDVPRTEFFTPVKKCYDIWLQAYTDFYTPLDMNTWTITEANPGAVFPDIELFDPPLTENDLKSYWNELQNLIDSFGKKALTRQMKSLHIKGKVRVRDAEFIGRVAIDNKSPNIVDLEDLIRKDPDLRNKLHDGSRFILKNIHIVISADGRTVTLTPAAVTSEKELRGKMKDYESLKISKDSFMADEQAEEHLQEMSLVAAKIDGADRYRLTLTVRGGSGQIETTTHELATAEATELLAQILREGNEALASTKPAGGKETPEAKAGRIEKDRPTIDAYTAGCRNLLAGAVSALPAAAGTPRGDAGFAEMPGKPSTDMRYVKPSKSPKKPIKRSSKGMAKKAAPLSAETRKAVTQDEWNKLVEIRNLELWTSQGRPNDYEAKRKNRDKAKEEIGRIAYVKDVSGSGKGGPVGAIRTGGGELTGDEHKGENGVNAAIRALIRAGHYYALAVAPIGYQQEGDIKDLKMGAPNIAELSKAQGDNLALVMQYLSANSGINFIILSGLRQQLRDNKIAADLVFHPGRTRHSVYLDQGDFEYLLSLPNGAAVIIEAIRHERAHIENRELSEAQVEAMAPTYNVRRALAMRDVRSLASTQTVSFTEGSSYDESGEEYRKPLAQFAKFGTSGVRWLVPGYLNKLMQMMNDPARSPEERARLAAKYQNITSNGYTQEDFSVPNVGLVTKSIALYNLLKAQGSVAPVTGTTEEFRKKLFEKGMLVAYDNRPANRAYAEEIVRILAAYGIKATIAVTDNREVPTSIPLVSLMVIREGFAGAITLTASHNGDEWDGIKFNTEDGAPASVETTAAIAPLLKEEIDQTTPSYMVATKTVDQLREAGAVQTIDAIDAYVKAVIEYIGPERIAGIRRAIAEKRVTLKYSAFFGSSALPMQKLFAALGLKPEDIIETAKANENIYVESYEPSLDKLVELKKATEAAVQRKEAAVVLGGAADNDADRFQVNENGVEFRPDRLTPILGHYLATSRGLTSPDMPWGRSFVSSTYQDRVAKALLGQETVERPTGFKFSNAALPSGIIYSEESYGLSFHGWTLDKDGIMPTILALDLVANSGMSLAEYDAMLKRELAARGEPSDIVFDRDDRRLDNDTKNAVIERFQAFYKSIVPKVTTFAGFTITGVYEPRDWEKGMKFVLGKTDTATGKVQEVGWVAFRSSGTEPIVRLYREGISEEVFDAVSQAMYGLVGIQAPPRQVVPQGSDDEEAVTPEADEDVAPREELDFELGVGAPTERPLTAEEAAREARIKAVVDSEAAALKQTLDIAWSDPTVSDNMTLVLLYDTDLAPKDLAGAAQQVIQAGEEKLNTYLHGSVIEVRAKGARLYENAEATIKDLMKSKKKFAVVAMTGSATFSAVQAKLIEDVNKINAMMESQEQVAAAHGAHRPFSAVIKVSDGRMSPIALYDIAVNLGYNIGENNILMSLNSTARNARGEKFTRDDLLEMLKKGWAEIRPIKPFDPDDLRRAYAAMLAAIHSL